MQASVFLNGKCNNNCFFCSKCQKPKTTTQAQNEITQLKKQGASELSITGSEPTLRKDLFKLVSFAKKTGFEKTTLQTNARMLYYEDFVKGLAKAGCTEANIALYSHNAQTHDQITQTKNSWEQTISGIKNAQKNGLRVTATIPVLPQNLEGLFHTVGFLAENEVKKVVLNNLECNCGQKTRSALSYDEAVLKMLPCLDLEEKIQVVLDGIPPCKLDFSVDHLNWKLDDLSFKRGILLESCRKCRYYASCPGIQKEYLEKHGKQEFALPVKAKLLEVKMEVTPRCNSNCAYCYNRYSFAQGKKRPEKEVESEKWERVIKEVAKKKIPLIKFSGGEPLLRKDIGGLLSLAKSLGLFVILNTNGLLLPEKFDVVKKNADIVILSLQSIDENDWEKSFSAKKIETLKGFFEELKDRKVLLHANTIATRKNIANLDKFRESVLELGFDRWCLLRPLSHEKSQRLNNSDVEKLVEKLLEYKNQGGTKSFLEHAIPFCACSKPGDVLEVCEAYKFTMNNQAFTIDPFGMAKPSSMMHLDLGNAFESSLEEIWSHPFVKSQQSLDILLPLTCKKCNYLGLCRGGSREQAKSASGRPDAMDPLARPKLLENELFRKR
ncbi:MAG: radical SAM/SPASM domain-containing protein [Candidatus Micrarchaeia archaeon]